MKKIVIVIVLCFSALTWILLNAPPIDAATTGVKIYTQWALAAPRDWDLVSASNWSTGPTKSDPIGDVAGDGTAIGDILLNNVKGYVFSIDVQGVIFNWYDHYAVEETPDAIVVTAWRDDPVLFPEGYKQADVGYFRTLKFDPKVNQDNTDQNFVIYAQDEAYNDWMARGIPENYTLMHWSDFVLPDPSVTKPGIYLSDSKWDEHVAAQTLHGWRQ